MEHITIGTFIDELLEKYKNKVINIPNHNDSVVLNLEENCEIIGVSNEEKTSWKKISQVSRHPANGQLMKINLKTGRSVTTTLSHSHLKRTTNSIIPIKGTDLKIGDRIPVARNIPILNMHNKYKYCDVEYTLDNDLGWLIGAYLADGNVVSNNVKIWKVIPEFIEKVQVCLTQLNIEYKLGEKHGEYGPGKYISFADKSLASLLKDKFATGSYNKSIPDFVFGSNKEFITGLIAGYFDGDGNVNVERSMIRVGSRSKQLISDISLLMSFIGIYGSVLKEKKSKEPEKILYNYCVHKKYAETFKNNISLVVKEKLSNLGMIIENNNRSRNSLKEEIDMIPELGNIISDCADILKIKDRSSTYGRWKGKPAIGRETLGKYIYEFDKQKKEQDIYNNTFETNMSILRQAYTSDVVWEEIVNIKILDDPKEYVYDFTVPGNDSFMVNNGIIVHNTLNSIDWEDKIMIEDRNTNNMIVSPIGKLIDDLVENEKTIRLKDNLENEMGDTYYLDTKDKNMYIQSVDENGKMHWKKIEAVTKHLPINKDGTNTLLKITTRSGRIVSATKAKSLLTRVDNKIVPVRGDDVKVGTQLPIMIKYPSGLIYTDYVDGIKLDGKLGYIDGQYIISTQSNAIPVYCYNANIDYVRGFIKGYINNNTHISCNTQDIAYGLNMLLARLNIQTTIEDKYVVISDNDMRKIMDDVSDDTLTEDVYYDEIVSIEEVQPTHKYVYDFTVEDTKNFNIFNGLCMRDSFHSAGIAAIGSITQGVPRIKELLSLAKKIKTPQMIIYLTNEYMASREMANKISSYIKYTTLGHILKKITVYYEPEPNNKDGFMEKDGVKNVYYTHNPTKNSCQTDINGLPWLMRIELDREKMLEKEVTMLEIKSKFCNAWDKRYADSKNIKKEEKAVLDKISQLAVISNTDNDVAPMIHIRFEMSEYDTVLIGQFIEQVVEKFKLKGIPLISDIATTQEERVLNFNNELHEIEKKNQYAIYTVGINLSDIRYITGIDPYKTICNDVIAMYITFGIEAARATLAREIAYAYERAGSSVNYHHLSVLVDTMTVNGYLTSIDRHGMNKSDIDPLTRASFEKTVDQLVTAAVFGEIDHMKGVSSRIIAGMVVKGGTGMCDLVLDTEMLEKSEYTVDIGQKYEKTFIPVNKNNVNEHFVGNEEDEVGIFIPMD